VFIGQVIVLLNIETDYFDVYFLSTFLMILNLDSFCVFIELTWCLIIHLYTAIIAEPFVACICLQSR